MTEKFRDDEDESDFEGQPFRATTLAEEMLYHNLRQVVDADLRSKIDSWHSVGFKANLNSAIRQYPS